ncbi:MAG TPA: phosphatidylserine/phosphatidylglycerophosphate/cardiolipin synthase family protein [Candidatus Dormibacteraeota bacterium]|nr:phosphatidylserine/phosphatidylglycerophosphate/cardiolipin synthase family protein [Candidatus Dormibacteraeota bacterium]
MARVVFLLFSLSLVGCSSPAHPVPALAAGSGAAQEVRLWQDASIFQLVGGLIGSAQRRVLVEMYELGRADIVRELGDAVGRGVSVRVITDPTVGASRKSAAVLDSLGVPERVYPVDDGRHQIDHVKLLIVDGEAAVGGMNWGKHSDRNHDYVLETRVKVEVERLARIFEQDWSLAGGHPFPLAAITGEVAQTAPGSEIRTMLVAALTHAMRRALAEVYTLTDPEVVAELVAAHRRGALVRVLLDPNQSYNLHAYSVLRAGGVEVRWYPVPRGILLHAKIGLFDGGLVLGSANWTLSGLGVNHELDIETGDPVAVAAYAARFVADWARAGG